MRIINYTLISVFIIFYSCSPTASSVKDYTTPEFQKEITRTVTLLDIISDELNFEEKEQIKEKLLYEIKLRYKNVAFYEPGKYINEKNESSFNNLWNPFWKKYLNTGVVDPVALFEVSEFIKSNAVLQAEVLDVEKIFGEHRQTIGQTTAKLKLGLFSLKSGKLLWEATVTGTQKNAHSDQTVPAAIEAVNIAVTNLIDKFPFDK